MLRNSSNKALLVDLLVVPFLGTFFFLSSFAIGLDSSIVFFISPRKFNKSVKNIKYFFSGRKILVCREMTKFFEEYIRSDVDELETFKVDPKGELTIVISEKEKQKNSSINLSESDKKNIQKLIKKLSIKDITNLISQNSNVQKKEIYNYCLKLKNEK
jgi:16S rRNA (cytidine1402-2'-O)-methyltransferase